MMSAFSSGLLGLESTILGDKDAPGLWKKEEMEERMLCNGMPHVYSYSSALLLGTPDKHKWPRNDVIFLLELESAHSLFHPSM